MPKNPETCPAVHWPKYEMPKLLQGQKALLTGASSGSGMAVAEAIGRSGADVIVNYLRGGESAQAVVGQTKAHGVNAIAIHANVSNEEQVKAMFQKIFQEFGTIDIRVNNAGLQADAPVETMTLAQWNLVMNVNLTVQWLCAKEAIIEFKRRGVVPEVSCAAGKIICMSSVLDIIPRAGHVNYAAPKGGVMLMMKSLAQECAPYRIRVNFICPGAIKTPINTDAWESDGALRELMSLVPYNRIAETGDIAGVAVFLASDMADYFIGTNIYVDGGMTLYPPFEGGG